MEDLNGRMIACQILVTGLIARVANDSKDLLRFLSDFRDEILAVVRQVRIAGALDTDRVRRIAEQTVDELFSLMKPPSAKMKLVRNAAVMMASTWVMDSLVKNNEMLVTTSPTRTPRSTPPMV